MKIGRGVTDRAFKTFPESLQTIIADYCENGGNIFVSGAYVATDLWDNGDVNESDKRFANEILHYTWRTGQASVSGQVKPQLRRSLHSTRSMSNTTIRSTKIVMR